MDKKMREKKQNDAPRPSPKLSRKAQFLRISG